MQAQQQLHDSEVVHPNINGMGKRPSQPASLSSLKEKVRLPLVALVLGLVLLSSFLFALLFLLLFSVPFGVHALAAHVFFHFLFLLSLTL